MHVQRQEPKFVISLVPVNKWLKDTMQSKQNCQSEVGIQANWSVPAHVLAICFSRNFCHPFAAFKVLPVMAQAEEDYRMLRAFSS